MKRNNKGISAVVATVLIILITIAAVGIIWTAVIPMIRNQISGGTVCFDAEAAVEIGASYSCKNDDNVTIQVRHTAAGAGEVELTGLKLKYYSSDGESYVQEIESDLPGTNTEKVYTRSYSEIDSDGDLTNSKLVEVSVIPIVQSGQSTRECNEGQRVAITECN